MRAKFELPEKLHVTLAFLGSVDAAHVDGLSVALREAAAGVAPFEVRFDTIGAFPNERRARIAWAGARARNAQFSRLAARVRDASRAFATLDEKPAVLHVTLARLRDPALLPAIRIAPRAMGVDEVVLLESLPGEKTTRYEVVERFPLTVHASSPAGST